MDISKIKPGRHKVKLKHPGTGAYLGLNIECMSPQDKEAAVARKALNDGSDDALLPAEGEEKSVAFLAALVTGWDWEGDASWGGKKLTFTTDNVKTVLSEPWVRAQLNADLSKPANFFQQ